MMNDNQDFYNRITISDFLLQLITMYWVVQDASNNDLMQELQRQDREYLDKIIDNQKKILSILSKNEDMSADK